MPPLDSSCQAEYADGFVLDETEHHDVSPYDPQFNILRDILDKRPEEEHGKLVRFSVFYKDQRHDVDWRGLPDNARPIRFRGVERDFHGDGSASDKRITWVRFGYQYTNENGKSTKEVKEL